MKVNTLTLAQWYEAHPGASPAEIWGAAMGRKQSEINEVVVKIAEKLRDYRPIEFKTIGHIDPRDTLAWHIKDHLKDLAEQIEWEFATRHPEE